MIKLLRTIFILGITNGFGQAIVPSDIRDKIRPTFDLTDYRISGDTLILVSTDNFLYYPFGAFGSLEKLKAHYESLYNENRGATYLVSGDSYVKFFYDEDKKKFEIVYAKILTAAFTLVNGIKCGMTQKDVFNRFFLTAPDNLDKIRVLELESALAGLWHYYQFNNGILTKYFLDSDYQEDKN